MSVPTWSGDEHPIGMYRYRILWFRVLFVAGLGAAFGSGYALGVRDPAADPPQPVAEPPQPVVVTVEEASSALETPVEGLPEFVFEDRCEEEDGFVPISAADSAALLAAARQRIATAGTRHAPFAEQGAAQSQEAQAYLAEQVVSVDFERTEFSEVLRSLARSTELNYGLSSEARELVEGEAQPVSLCLKEVSLRNALNLIVGGCEGLGYELRGGTVWIYAEYEAESQTTEIYRVSDLIDGSARDRGGVELEGDVLISLVEQTLPEFEGWLEFQGGVLIARMNAAHHVAVRRLINQLRTGIATPTAEAPGWVTALEDALATRRVVLDVDAAPLQEVLHELHEKTGLNLILREGVDSDTSKITLAVKGVSAGDALGLILEQCGLDSRLANEAIVIEDPSRKDREVSLAVFDVRDLLTWLDPDTLMELVYCELGEERWEDPASFEIQRGYAFVFQGPDQLEGTRDVLAKLRVSYAEGAADLRR